jgi:hypothetical protein
MQAEIGKYRFVLCSKTLIAVYDGGDEPFTHIRLDSSLTDEKDFHYEIMDWYSKYTEE